MDNKHFITAFSATFLLCSHLNAQKIWTLQQCLDYAMDHNIQLQQKKISAASSHEDVLQSKGQLLPSVSFSTNQNFGWRPFAESTVSLTNGTMSTIRNTTSHNSSYGINANYTLWNGNRNINQIKQSQLNEEVQQLGIEEQANSIQEKITQLYVQILYENEAVSVNKEIIKASEMQRDRAEVMLDVGTIARVDLVQLEAQVAQDKYSLAQAESQLENYKLQLKQLLEIHDNEDFNIVIPNISDNAVLAVIPDKESIYNAAISHRPEIKSSKLNIESSEVAIAAARSGYMPTINLSASIGTNHSSGMHTEFFNQLKTNLSNSLGVTVAVPLFDAYQTRTSIRKAKYALKTSELNLEESQKQLYSTIENYWLNATTSQKQYIYAKANQRSMKESYELVSEQFKLGLKNIVELTTGKNNLLQAEQQLLQTKYTALLNVALLQFYAGERISLSK